MDAGVTEGEANGELLADTDMDGLRPGPMLRDGGMAADRLSMLKTGLSGESCECELDRRKTFLIVLVIDRFGVWSGSGVCCCRVATLDVAAMGGLAGTIMSGGWAGAEDRT